MTPLPTVADITSPARLDELAWNGDNAKFVVEDILPRILTLGPETREVIRFAYGYDLPPDFALQGSYEAISDGSSDCPNEFMDGFIKEPQGVGHDWLYELHRLGLADPKGHVWTFNEANIWYARAEWELNYHARAVDRYIGLTLFGWIAWNEKPHTKQGAAT